MFKLEMETANAAFDDDFEGGRTLRMITYK
jgi:hypothetical protein